MMGFADTSKALQVQLDYSMRTCAGCTLDGGVIKVNAVQNNGTLHSTSGNLCKFRDESCSYFDGKVWRLPQGNPAHPAPQKKTI
jgi:hypothetical protein